APRAECTGGSLAHLIGASDVDPPAILDGRNLGVSIEAAAAHAALAEPLAQRNELSGFNRLADKRIDDPALGDRSVGHRLHPVGTSAAMAVRVQRPSVGWIETFVFFNPPVEVCRQVPCFF